MTYEEENYVLASIEQIKKETHENNVMLKQIIKVINIFILSQNKENLNDFGRNILANLISNGFDIGNLLKRR